MMNEVIEHFLNFIKDFNFETDETCLELEDNTLPIFAIIYFCIRAGKRKIALEIASKSKLPDVKVIHELLKNEVDNLGESIDNKKLYNTAIQALSDISRRQADESNESIGVYKKDIFKEALLLLFTKQITPSHALLNTNLSDYLWFSLQKCYFNTSESFLNNNSDNLCTLKLLKGAILSYGESYFNEDGSSPLNFYKVLIFTSQFEEAISYLDSIDQHRIENTHVALAINSIGLFEINEQDDMNVDALSSNLRNAKSKKNVREPNLFAKIIKNYIKFLGSDYLSQSIIYATLLDYPDVVNTLADLFVKHNNFSVLLETAPSTGLDLITKKNLPLSTFLNNENLTKIIHKVCKKVSRTTEDPHISILLQNKIGNDKEVVGLLCKWQNLQITQHSELIEGAVENYYTRQMLMKKDNFNIEDASKKYNKIVEKILGKATKGSYEHKEFKIRLDNLQKVVEFINLVIGENYDKAYSEMKKAQFLPFNESIEPDLANIQHEILENLPEVVHLAFAVIDKKLSNTQKMNIGFNSEEAQETHKLKEQKLSLITYFKKIQKIFMNSLSESSLENAKKVEKVKRIAQKISKL
jgi:hypothetical protein